MAQLDDVTAPSYLEGLGEWPLSDVRARRDEVNEVETGLSYLRRIVQGRLDIVLAELRRRQEGDGAGDAGDLVDHLPEILGDKLHAPGLGRLPALMGPGALDPTLEARLNEVLSAAKLTSLSLVGDQELAEASEGLVELERLLSGRRRTVCDVIDNLQDELVRRYRTGEASVDSLLP